jgi:hypothetical protein
LLLPHFPRSVALRSCLQIQQILTFADVLFLRRAKKSRIPLQPWVEEMTESTAEGRMRHNFQTEWGVYWDCAAGPLSSSTSGSSGTTRKPCTAQDLSSTAPRNCAPRNCAPRKSRRANRAAQIAPRNCRRAIHAAQPRLHTAPIL